MKHPSSKKEIQQLNEKITAISRFIFRSVERCLPFFKTLQQTKDFLWSDECQQSFEDLKKYLASPPLLTKSKVGEILYLYLATSIEMINSVLIQEDKNWIHRSIYYTSKVLHNIKVRYSRAEKMIYHISTTTSSVLPSISNYGLDRSAIEGDLTSNWYVGQMAKWTVKLGEFDIQYRPRPSMKVQVLADFITECTISDNKSENTYDNTIKQVMTPKPDLRST